jgi:hypothetical protein
MLSFKEFLSEAAVGNAPTFQGLTLENAVRLVKDDCSIYKKYGICFYRGETTIAPSLRETGYAIVDPSKTERVSQNTSNHYTVLFDNHPDMKDYPKRSRSFIASTSKSTAEGFAENNHGIYTKDNVYALIPLDGVKIGVINRNDMWKTLIKLFGAKSDVYGFNMAFEEELGIKPTMEGFMKFDKLLKERNPAAVKKVVVMYKQTTSKPPDEQVFDNFMPMIWDAFSPAKTGFQLFTANNYQPPAKNSEVWIGGKCIAILYNHLKEFQKANV